MYDLSDLPDLSDFPEVSALREMRSDVPLSGPELLAPQRELLTAAFRRSQEETVAARTLSPPRRRLLLVGAAAVACLAVTGGVVAVLSGDGTGPARLLSAQASDDTLELAASTVEKLGAKEPGPKQWVYVKSTSFGQDGPETFEQWTRWDGTGGARLPRVSRPRGTSLLRSGRTPGLVRAQRGGEVEEGGYDDRSQRQFYRFLATLPSDPDRMMKRIRQEHAIGDIPGETPAERDWREIDVLYRSVLIPPNVQAGLFRALAKIPGARVEKGVEDPLGRPAIGVTVTYAERTASGAEGSRRSSSIRGRTPISDSPSPASSPHGTPGGSWTSPAHAPETILNSDYVGTTPTAGVGVNRTGSSVRPRSHGDGRRVSASAGTARSTSGSRSRTTSMPVRAMTSATSCAGNGHRCSPWPKEKWALLPPVRARAVGADLRVGVGALEAEEEQVARTDVPSAQVGVAGRPAARHGLHGRVLPQHLVHRLADTAAAAEEGGREPFVGEHQAQRSCRSSRRSAGGPRRS